MREKKLQSAITFLSVERFLKTWAQHKEDKIVFNLKANTVPLLNLIKKYSAKTHLDAYQCAPKKKQKKAASICHNFLIRGSIFKNMGSTQRG